MKFIVDRINLILNENMFPVKHPGTLHDMLGIPRDKTIPKGMIHAAAKKPGLLGKRARYALNMMKSHH
jgi:hypothetical protein